MTKLQSLAMSRSGLRDEINDADRDLMHAVVAGCAIISNADGWVGREERRRMSGMVRAIDSLAGFSRDELLTLFKELNARFEANHEEASQHALSSVAKLRGQRNKSELLLTICMSVAGADGGFDGEERLALIKMCEALNLDPVDWELQTTP
jgi:tellurite resistance protein TerB